MTHVMEQMTIPGLDEAVQGSPGRGRWEMVKLGDVCKVTSGGTPNRKHPEYFSGSIPWVKTGDLKQKYITSPEEYISEEGVQNSSAKLFPKETVLIALYGATIGACSILKIEATTNQACGAILPSHRVIPEFLYLFLCSNRQTFISQGVGGAQPNISGGILKETYFPLPPLPEQQRIVARLDKAQQLIDKRKEQLALMDSLVQSLFYEMFGDPVKNEKGWEVKPLGSVVNKLTDGTHKTPVYLSEGVVFISAKNVKNGYLTFDDTKFISESEHSELTRRCKPEINDILITKSGSIGMSALVDVDFEFSLFESLALVKYHRNVLNGHYLKYHLNDISVAKQYANSSKGGTIKHLHLNELRKVLLLIPPLPLQQTFAERVQQIEALKQSMTASLRELEHNFNSLMQEAFGG